MKDIIQNNNKNIKIDQTKKNEKKKGKISDVQRVRRQGLKKKCCLQNKCKNPRGVNH